MPAYFSSNLTPHPQPFVCGMSYLPSKAESKASEDALSYFLKSAVSSLSLFNPKSLLVNDKDSTPFFTISLIIHFMR